MQTRTKGVAGLLACALGLGVTDEQSPPPEIALTVQESGVEALLQAVSAVDELTAWASGHQGAILRTQDGGETWQVRRVPDADTLQFRDVHGFDHLRAVVLSAGSGPLSRLYRTQDGGATWELAFTMSEAAGFLDCLDFWDQDRGFAYGDSFDGVPYILTTADGGRTWIRPSASDLPSALEGEGGFAASGTCARTGSDGVGWVGTGAGPRARVLRTDDFGRSWTAAETPMGAGAGAGIFSLVTLSANHIVAAGGDLGAVDALGRHLIESRDGGVTWRGIGGSSLPGPRYGADGSAVADATLLVTVGPAGAEYSWSEGAQWSLLDSAPYWAVDLTPVGRGWLVGPSGRIVRLDLAAAIPR